MIASFPWETAVRIAGALHFVTLVMACFTPVPENWDRSLASLPEMHRRFALAQNFSIGATIAVLGALSLFFAAELVSGTPLARAICGATALFWGGRALILPWIGVSPVLRTPGLKVGYALLLAECASYAIGYGLLAVGANL